jgi:hypothetical protein
LVISKFKLARIEEPGTREMVGKIIRAKETLFLGRGCQKDEVCLKSFRLLGVETGQGQKRSGCRAVIHGSVVDLIPLFFWILSQMIIMGREDDIAVFGFPVRSTEQASDIFR